MKDQIAILHTAAIRLVESMSDSVDLPPQADSLIRVIERLEKKVEIKGPWIKVERKTLEDGSEYLLLVQGIYDEEIGETLVQVDIIPALKVPK